MASKISRRLSEIVNALPLQNGYRVLEIGCGTGAAAREIVNLFENVYVLGIDRSIKAIEQSKISSKSEIQSGKLNFIQSEIEDFELPETEQLFDLAFAVRVGALDGRHPQLEKRALANISKCLKKTGKLFIDGGDPLKEIKL
jgi:cyclopropane fatty-acyl-phospholipid synthase-like methyltransferase